MNELLAYISNNTDYTNLYVGDRHIIKDQLVYVLQAPSSSKCDSKFTSYHYTQGILQKFSVSNKSIISGGKSYIVRNHKPIKVPVDFIFKYVVMFNDNEYDLHYVERKNLYFEDEFEMLQNDIQMLNKVLQLKRKQQQEMQELTNKLKNEYNWDYDNFYTEKIK